MAASDAVPVPRKNVAYRFYFAIRKPSDSTLITSWAGQDSEVSLDGAAYSDCTNEATEIGTSGTGYIDLTASEMNADCVILKVTVTNTGAVPLVFVLYPEESGDYRSNVTQISGDATAADNAEAFFDGTGYAGTNNVIPTVTTLTNLPAITAGWLTATGIAADAITAAKLAADVTTELQSGLATAAALATVDTVVDTILAATEDIDTRTTGMETTVNNIVADTNELQTDWANGGRLDVILDARASQASVDTVYGIVGDILVDTGTTLPATLATLATAANLATVAGYLDTEIAAILEDTGTTIPAQISALNNLSSANVLTQINAALDTAISELSAAAPTATPTLRTGLMLLYMALRNRTTTTASAQTIQNDAGSTIATATLSDDGTTMTKGEFA